ncbi:MAG: ATP-binding cassette domain-containing protein [Nitrospirales bacterium]|nr:ATP-binding cassette domain-containing protein [Nitrospira sp.]MDR4500855.1 ATP-binding cassette domain-containing protein [Nitrospirales bacterium]
MGTMVDITGLRKEFGSIVAVDGVSFTVGQGEVLGFLGPNGAGKSTTMKMITGFLTPSGGTAKICGYDILDSPLEAKKRIGYLPEGAPAYQDMTPIGYLTFIGEMRGLYGEDLRTRIAETVEKVNLQSVLEQPIETLSKGFKRRLGLAQAILHDPEVLILDEPTDGLDPNQKHEVRTLIRTMAPHKAIILSTHILEEVQAVCTRAMIIAKGKVVTDGTPADLEGQSPMHNTVVLSVRHGEVYAMQAELSKIEGVNNVEELGQQDGCVRLRIFPDHGRWIIADVGQCAREQQWDVVELHVDRGHLDEVFRALTAPKQALT